jgi:hypothetical protein
LLLAGLRTNDVGLTLLVPAGLYDPSMPPTRLRLYRDRVQIANCDIMGYETDLVSARQPSDDEH